uniref:SFRICE_038570 n=1 Tax=Spodoptera frugiperda TaxID=7108 RepID=A0A2H1WQ26_SPOFR
MNVRLGGLAARECQAHSPQRQARSRAVARHAVLRRPAAAVATLATGRYHARARATLSARCKFTQTHRIIILNHYNTINPIQ